MKKIKPFLLFVFYILSSCDSHEKRTTYYEDGETIKSISAYNRNQIKDGTEIFYFESGKVSSIGIWKNGKKEGTFKEYFNTGNLAATFSFHNDLPIGETRIFDNDGRLIEIQYYDSAGILSDLKKFDKDGSQSKTIMPIWLVKQDSVNLGDTLHFSVKLGNLPDLRYLTGKFLRGTDFIKNEANKKSFLRDTLEVVDSHENSYTSKLCPRKRGANSIKGIIYVRLDKDTLHAFRVEYPYYVK